MVIWPFSSTSIVAQRTRQSKQQFLFCSPINRDCCLLSPCKLGQLHRWHSINADSRSVWHSKARHNIVELRQIIGQNAQIWPFCHLIIRLSNHIIVAMAILTYFDLHHNRLTASFGHLLISFVKYSPTEAKTPLFHLLLIFNHCQSNASGHFSCILASTSLTSNNFNIFRLYCTHQGVATRPNGFLIDIVAGSANSRERETYHH